MNIFSIKLRSGEAFDSVLIPTGTNMDEHLWITCSKLLDVPLSYFDKNFSKGHGQAGVRFIVYKDNNSVKFENGIFTTQELPVEESIKRFSKVLGINFKKTYILKEV